MESSETSEDRFLLVICPGCKEPLYPPREQGGTKIACPACGAAVQVPKPKLPAEPDPQSAPKEYGIHDPDYVARPANYIRMACPTCRTLLYAEPEREGQTITCPDCYTKVKVRRGEQHTPSKPKAEEIGEYQVLEDGVKSKVKSEDYFLFLCPGCNARLHPSRKHAGKRVRCPDCKEVLTVPQAPDQKEQARPAAVAAYGLEQEGSQPKRLGPEHYFSYFCPRCSARLRALRDDAGKKIDCPDCRTNISVPAAPEHRPQIEPGIFSEAPVANVSVPPLPRREPVVPDAIEHRIPQAKPPRWTFFSGVFQFPWRGDAIARWGMLSLGLVAAGLLVTAASSLMGEGLIGGFTLAFFGMAVLWISIWSFSFAAHCMLAIVEDTSAGADEIVSWPDSDWREWIWRMLQVGYLVAVSIAVGFGLSQLAGLWLPQPGLVWAATVFLLFPILLLSSVDANSPFIPLSRRVRRSLTRVAWAWLVFYALSALMWAAVAGAVWGIAGVHDFLTPVVGGPLLAAALLIYARLLGRLAWRATLRTSR